MRVLVVEDDAKLVRALASGLAQEGYTVDVGTTGDEALSQAAVHDYDAVLLDVMLPGIDGYDVCRALRRTDRWLPVLMLTARADVADRIQGLDAGADDYLVKPFDFGELLARLRALIRRGPAERPAVLEVGVLRVDPVGRSVTCDGEAVELSPREFAVLEFLARHAGQPVSRTQLLEHVWTDHREPSPNLVDVYIGYLRRKLGRLCGPSFIRTVRGIGFQLGSS
jgi:two-component system OmpR family response regulator